MQNNTNDYTGTEELEAMRVALNYNSMVVGWIVEEIENNKAEQIVDFGSGNGYLSDLVSKKCNKKINCVEIAENLFADYDNKDNLILYNSLEELPDNSIDFIYSSNVLEHIEDDAAIIKLFHRKLKENGVLLLYLPAFSCLYSSMDKKVGHFRRYTKQMVKELSDKENFHIERIEYADFAGFWITLLYKLFGSKEGKLNNTMLKIFDRFIFPLGRVVDKVTLGKICGKNVLAIVRKKS